MYLCNISVQCICAVYLCNISVQCICVIYLCSVSVQCICAVYLCTVQCICVIYLCKGSMLISVYCNLVEYMMLKKSLPLLNTSPLTKTNKIGHSLLYRVTSWVARASMEHSIVSSVPCYNSSTIQPYWFGIVLPLPVPSFFFLLLDIFPLPSSLSREGCQKKFKSVVWLFLLHPPQSVVSLFQFFSIFFWLQSCYNLKLLNLMKCIMGTKKWWKINKNLEKNTKEYQ